jgi:hypothetical protein
VAGEIRERHRHLAIAEQRKHRRKRDLSRRRRGLGAKRGRLLVPELLDREGSDPLAPLERRAISRHSILGECAGEPERVIAQEPAHTARLVEAMRQCAGPRARAILRRETEILLRHGERQRGRRDHGRAPIREATGVDRGQRFRGRLRLLVPHSGRAITGR